MHRIRRVCVLVMIMSLCLIIGGCLISTRQYTNQTSPGRELSKSLIKKIEPGVTTKEWLLQTFGMPTRQRTFDNGDETWEYERSYRTESESHVFFIINTENVTRTRETLIIDIKDGIVQNYVFE
jgi:outer membrane protein assembly factor BamE (lipoprotein component of BamABCDE complex)